MSEFWQMGGYAGYVWSAYGVALAVLAANIIWPYWLQRRRKRQLREELES